MKTYIQKKTCIEPLLQITYDKYPINPRKYTNDLGYFITIQKNYESPDINPELETIIEKTSKYTTSCEKQMELIKKLYEENTDEEVLKIYPVSICENSSIKYKLGNFSGFDTWLAGFYIVTQRKAYEAKAKEEDFEEIIKKELDLYNKYVNGEVYKYTLYNEYGKIIGKNSDFYDIEDIREHLPDEWKDEDLHQYVID